MYGRSERSDLTLMLSPLATQEVGFPALMEAGRPFEDRWAGIGRSESMLFAASLGRQQ